MIFPLTFQDDILTGKARGQWKTLGFVQPWACGVVNTAIASRDEAEDHHPVWLRDQEVQVRLPNVICNREDDTGGVIAEDFEESTRLYMPPAAWRPRASFAES